MKKTVMCCLALVMAACGSQPGRKAGDDVAAGVSLEQRAEERWSALSSKNFRLAYRYLSPGYRNIVTMESYEAQMSTKTVDWLSGKVTGTECENETLCTVDIYLEFEINMHMPGVGKQQSFQPVTENWIAVEDAWYFVPKS